MFEFLVCNVIVKENIMCKFFVFIVFLVSVIGVVQVQLLFGYYFGYFYVLIDLCLVCWLMDYQLGDICVYVYEDLGVCEIDVVIGEIKYVFIDDEKDLYDYFVMDVIEYGSCLFKVIEVLKKVCDDILGEEDNFGVCELCYYVLVYVNYVFKEVEVVYRDWFKQVC